MMARLGRVVLVAVALQGKVPSVDASVAFKMTRLSTTHEEMFLQALNDEGNSSSASGGGGVAKTKLLLGQGVHSVEVFFGGQPRVLIVDTGSADTAFPCSDCTNCGNGHYNTFYNFTSGSRYVSCEDNAAWGLTSCKSCSKDDKCVFAEQYVEGSGWEAFKVKDSCYFDQNPNVVADVVFGCMHTESGAFLSQEADGIMGMSRDPDALFVQFYEHGATKMKGFSQCISSTGGHMVLGGLDTSVHNPGAEMVFTPLRTTGYSYWTVSMESLAVDGLVVDVPSSVYNQNRGCVFDSGTTFVYLPSAAASPFQLQWTAAVLAAGLDHAKFAPYREGGEYVIRSPSVLLQLPTLSFKFANNAVMQLPPTQYMVYNGDFKYTATVFFQDFAHATILGASMLANHNVLYDMTNHRVGFAEANCDSVDAAYYSGVTALLVTDVGGDTFTPEQSYVQWLLQMPSLAGFVLGVVMLFVGREVVDVVSNAMTRNGMFVDAVEMSDQPATSRTTFMEL
ncbi:hypothetical protein DYB38_012514 [Aphanomyces astaci]|uniref:Peptidase A1 domain-containing protein n=1 Tax=Aphanomyces astaci TaxID=112090 RepID=A0A397CZ20_APHAT|nr:hypothetical protein DYB38_012514 [Aphanomyces astaci]